MGCCGSKKKPVDDDDPPEEPPPKKEEEKQPDPAPRQSEAQTLENQYLFQQEQEKPVEEVAPRKETLEEEEPPSMSELDGPQPEEECTPIGASVAGGKGEVEPIEPVKIPMTSQVDRLGPGDKNHVIVTQPMLSPGGHQAETMDNSRLNPTTESYYTDQTATDDTTGAN